MKQITKSYLLSLVELGFTIKDMKHQIKVDFKSDVTIGYLRLALKRFGIDLRKKPQKTDVVFVDDTADTAPQGYQLKEGYTLAEVREASTELPSITETIPGATNAWDM